MKPDNEHHHSGDGSPRVVIAHDYLTQRGGAERVVLAMLEAFPNSRVVTSVYAPEDTYVEFKQFDITTSWLSEVAAFRADPRRALPFLAPTWTRTKITDADVVLCSSSGWAHGVQTTVPKIVYCHNPARWLYQREEYLDGAHPAIRAALTALGPLLRRWDQRRAAEAHTYLANSSAVADRIETTYGRTAGVLHPPIGISDGPLEPVPGIEPGYLLTVGRSRGYKHGAMVAEAVEAMPQERLVAVGGLPEGNWTDRLSGFCEVPDTELRWLYANAAALVGAAYEDFGLTPIEAYKAGTPALVLRAGGYLDTTVPGITGEFIETPDVTSIVSTVHRFRSKTYSTAAIREHAAAFSTARFIEQIRTLVAGVTDGAPGGVEARIPAVQEN